MKKPNPAAAAASKSLRMKAIVAGDNSPRSRLLPMRGVEMLGIKGAWIELPIALNIRIFLTESFLVVDVNFDARSYPTSRHLAVIFKADILKLIRIGLRWLKQPDEQ